MIESMSELLSRFYGLDFKTRLVHVKRNALRSALVWNLRR